ncbi:hypothetical protein VIGAN_05265700 [Vigna angularis var. angularis]|uniref:Uncharacterized protein n=1 Tax=Vigna angularis var. angularis TaxID=157739 RepID=A0A0S3S818_PHAAN|nr:hypothetical protein VIGAN_05265700 [Vigna angularis var. angularis]
MILFEKNQCQMIIYWLKIFQVYILQKFPFHHFLVLITELVEEMLFIIHKFIPNLKYLCLIYGFKMDQQNLLTKFRLDGMWFLNYMVIIQPVSILHGRQIISRRQDATTFYVQVLFKQAKKFILVHL